MELIEKLYQNSRESFRIVIESLLTSLWRKKSNTVCLMITYEVCYNEYYILRKSFCLMFCVRCEDVIMCKEFYTLVTYNLSIIVIIVCIIRECLQCCYINVDKINKGYGGMSMGVKWKECGGRGCVIGLFGWEKLGFNWSNNS